MQPDIISGDLLRQPVAAIVNPWNQNRIPWWLLRPHGVSGAIKREGGVGPFRELAAGGPMDLGSARLTSGGRLPYSGIIHVAKITLWGRSNASIITKAVQSAMAIVEARSFESVAFPILGSGSAGMPEETALAVMLETFTTSTYLGHVRIVRYGSGS